MLTVAEVAKQLRICNEVVRIKVRKGLLRSYKPGKAYLFKQSDVDFYLEKFHHGAKYAQVSSLKTAKKNKKARSKVRS